MNPASSHPTDPAGGAPALRQPMLSVVMTGYTLQRLPDMLEAIESLSRQTYPHLEIIFVAEGPEKLGNQVAAYGRERGVADLRVVVNDGDPGLTFARNVGVQHARGEFVAFFDDDAVAAPDWAEHLVETFAAYPEAIGLTGQALPLWRGEDAPWFPDELDWILGSTRFTGWHELRPVRNAAGVNMAFRREAFEHCRFSTVLVGGNQGDPTGIKRGLVGDDTLFSLELCARTKRPILFDPAVVVYNKVYPYRLKPEYVRRRAFWEGYTKATLMKFRSGDYAIRLSTESNLLRRILLSLLPRTLWQLLDRPALAWRRLSMTVTVLFHLSLGYAAGRFPLLSGAIVQQYT